MACGGRYQVMRITRRNRSGGRLLTCEKAFSYERHWPSW
jgi:hypothetical protein